VLDNIIKTQLGYYKKLQFHHLINMKSTMVFILSLIACSLAQAATTGALKGYSDPDSAVSAFLTPLESGISGVSQSVQSISVNSANPDPSTSKNALIKNSRTANTQAATANPMQSTLTSIMRVNGKLVSFQKTDQQIRYGGKMVKIFYDLYFLSGPKMEMMFTVLQPSLTGGYQVMDAQITNSNVTQTSTTTPLLTIPQ
jgi:hypothetical protein